MMQTSIHIGSIVVPFWGSYLESYTVIPKTNYYGVNAFASATPRPVCSWAQDYSGDFNITIPPHLR